MSTDTSSSLVSCVILAKDEEKHLYSCVEYIKHYFKQKNIYIIVDKDCRDNTMDIANKLDVNVIERKFSGSFAIERNFADSITDTTWNLHCDVDERFNPIFLSKIDKIIQNYTDIFAFTFPRINIDTYSFITYNNYPDFQTRLINKRQCQWKRNVHEIVINNNGKPIIQTPHNRYVKYEILHLKYRNRNERWKKIL